MSIEIAFLAGGIIFAIYLLVDKWIESKSEITFQEAERLRIANEAAEFELEKRKDVYYGTEVDQ